MVKTESSLEHFMAACSAVGTGYQRTDDFILHVRPPGNMFSFGWQSTNTSGGR